MIRCQEAAELIPLHVGDDLPAEEARHVEEHLEQCALCTAEYASFASARSVLFELRADLPARGSLWAEVARGLEADVLPASGPQVPTPAPRSWTWLKWSSLAAAALVVMTVLPPLLRSDADPAVVPGAESPMIQATTPEELQNFLLRTGGMFSPATDPALNPVGSDANPQSQDVPLTTPAGIRPPRRL